MSLSVDLSICV